jgi:hypothetical protein
MNILNTTYRRITCITLFRQPVIIGKHIVRKSGKIKRFGKTQRWIGLGLILAVLMLSSGCQPLTATLPPTPEIVRVQLTPALNSWDNKLHTCAAALPGIGLVVDSVPADQLDPNSVDLSLRFGLPTEFSQKTTEVSSPVILSTDTLVIIVNASNPLEQLSPETVAAIFSGRITRWNDLQPESSAAQPATTDNEIQAWSLPQGDDVRQVFDEAFMQGSNLYRQTHFAPDLTAMLEAISDNPGAIGYLLSSQVQASVRVLNVEGQPGIDLEQPVLAYATQYPQGKVRQLLLCLQGKKN